MSFNNFTSSVKLNKIQTYNNVNNNANAVFKNTFYDDIEEINYNEYANINYDSINLNESIQKAIENGAMEEEKNWYDVPLTFLASAGNTVMGVAEGILEFGEDIFDAACWVSTISRSWVPLLVDVGTGIFTGDWNFSTTGAYFNEAASFIGRDLVDEGFDKLYQTQFFSSMEDNAGAAFKREGGVVYGIAKSTAYYATATAVSSVIPVNPALAKGLTFGVSKFGDAIEGGLKKVTTNEDGTKRQASAWDLARETIVAGAKGAVEGGIMAGATKIGATGKDIKDLSKSLGLGNDFIKFVDGVTNVKSVALKATKPLANELIGLINGEEFNVKEVLIDSAAVVASESFAIGMKSFNSKISIKSDPSTPNNAKIIEGNQLLENSETSTEGSNIISEFFKTTKSAVVEGVNKGIEKAEKEGVKAAIDGIVSIVD